MKKTLQEEKERILQIMKPIIEGNAFSGAANKAKEEGKDTFEFDGKTFNVSGTVKKAEETDEEKEDEIEEPKKATGETNMAIGFGVNPKN
jgi:hypothetical protein